VHVPVTVFALVVTVDYRLRLRSTFYGWLFTRLFDVRLRLVVRLRLLRCLTFTVRLRSFHVTFGLVPTFTTVTFARCVGYGCLRVPTPFGFHVYTLPFVALLLPLLPFTLRCLFTFVATLRCYVICYVSRLRLPLRVYAFAFTLRWLVAARCVPVAFTTLFSLRLRTFVYSFYVCGYHVPRFTHIAFGFLRCFAYVTRYIRFTFVIGGPHCVPIFRLPRCALRFVFAGYVTFIYVGYTFCVAHLFR